VVGEYQKRMEEVANYSDVDLTLLVPKYWSQFNKRVNLERNGDSRFRILSVQPITWGWRKNNLRNVTHMYPGMKKILESLQPDIIELWEEPFSVVTAHTSFWARRIISNAKIIFFSAQNVFKKYPYPFSAFEKYTYNGADHAFLMNRSVAEIVREKGYRKQFTILPLGVDPETFHKKKVYSLKNRLGIRDFVVGFVGKITSQKGILDLVEAVSQINKRIQLLIIGNGDLRGEVENRVRSLGLERQTINIDAVPHSEVPDYLNCMDLLVLPSVTLPHLREQFGRILIEGMACEVPVLGSDSGEIPTTIGKAGLIFREGDVRDLKEKIEAFIRNRDLRAMLAQRGRKRVLGHFSWKKISEKQYQVYTELMSQNTWAI
jgi:glycosyltransferase involved in cell wall biosynthesis